MRFAAAVVLWLLTTAALAVAIPAAWAQLNIVDEDGYAGLAQDAARDPALQAAVASELSTRAMALITEHGGQHALVNDSTVHDAAAGFTASPAFPPLFAQLNRSAHTWLFSAPQSGQNGDQWVVDVAPMLREPSIQQVLAGYGVKVPATLKIPLTVSVPESIRPGQLRALASWGPWVSIGAVAASAIGALLTLLVARSRGRALTSLGVSALLVGAAGWAGMEIAGGRINEALNRTTGDVRRMADMMVGHAEDGLHGWLNLTLAAGAGLVVLGVAVAILGGLVKK